MNLPENLARAFDRLCAHYVRREEEDGAARQSGEGAFEAQMAAKAMAQRHRPMIVSRSWTGGYRVAGTDLACGCDVHCYHPAREGGRDHDGPDVRLDARPDPVATALRSLDSVQTGRLERLARVMLPRRLFVFGAPFKSEGGERMAAPLRGVAQEPSRGPGTIADLSDTAARLWGARAREEVDQLGRRIAARKASAADRELARAIRVETEAMARAALTALDGALRLTPRLPAPVARANERRAAA